MPSACGKARLSTRWTSAVRRRLVTNPRRERYEALARAAHGSLVGRRLLATALGAAAVLAIATSAAQARPAATQLSLVAYSTPAGAFSKIIPAFQKTAAGKDVTFKQSYAASGQQAAAVHNGLPADVVNLSLAPDVTVLSQAGLIKTTWNKDQFGGMVTDSIVVFAVRKGNPKNIKTWADLIKPGIQVINPNPFTSGGARWNVMAAWGAQIKQKKTPKQANDYLAALYKNISVQDSSARASLNTFLGGKGDVLLGYEERDHPGAAGGRRHPVHPAVGHPPDREPDRGAEELVEPGPGQRVRSVHALGRGAGDLGAVRLPPGAQERLQQVCEDVPRAEAALHDPRHRQGRLAGGAAEVLRPEQGHRQAGSGHVSERGGG